MENDSRKHPPPGRALPPERERPHLSLEAPRGEIDHAQDHWRVNLAEAWEIAFWSREFHCSEAELRKAVEAVGSLAGAVRTHLHESHLHERN